MAGVRRRRARGGGRSSGNSGDGAMVHGRRGWWALRPPGSSLSTAVCSDSSCGGSSHAGDEARRRRASGTAALALGSVRSDGKKGRTAEELTAVPQGWSVGSGMSCRRRIERRRASVAGDGTSMVAAEAQVQVGMGLRCANKRGKVLRRLCAMRGARWAHARDQMVTGASPATGAAAAKVRPWRGYSVESGRDQGRRGRRCGCSQRVRWRRRRGRGRSGCCESTTTAVGAEDEGNNDDGAAGHSGVV